MEIIKSIVKNKSIFLNIFFSLMFVLGLNNYFYDDNLFIKRSFFYILLFAFCIILLKKNNEVKINQKKCPLILAIILSLSLVIGKVIYNYYDITILFNKSIFLNSIIIFIGFTKIFEEIIYIIFEKLKELNITQEKIWKLFKSKYAFFAFWILIFIAWIPAFLAYYPGILSYDSGWQTYQAFNGFTEYTKLHPPLHTLIWQICIEIYCAFDIEALPLYGIIQMIFLSFTLAKLVKFFVNRVNNNWVILISLLFFMLNPVIAIFSISMTKDTYFSIFFILFIIEIMKLVEKPKEYLTKKRNWVLFIITSVLMLLFRNNGIYVYILLGIIMFFVLRKNYKKISILLVLPIVLYCIVDIGIYKMLKIQDGDSKESLSVPIQQISYVVNKHGSELDNEEKEEINKFLSYEKAIFKYNIRWADPMKDTFNTKYFNENKLEFFKLYFRLLGKYPADFISAAISLNLPYWYFDANTIGEYARPYIETDIRHNGLYDIERESKSLKALGYYSKVASFEMFEGVPFISNIFSITTPIWLTVFTIFVLIYKKYYKKILYILPLLFLWLTYMAGPVSNFRYILPFVLLYPLLIVLILNKDNNAEIIKG